MIIRVHIVLMALVVSAAGQDLTRQVRDMGAERQRRMAAAQRCSTNSDAAVTWREVRDAITNAVCGIEAADASAVGPMGAAIAAIDPNSVTNIAAAREQIRLLKQALIEARKLAQDQKGSTRDGLAATRTLVRKLKATDEETAKARKP